MILKIAVAGYIGAGKSTCAKIMEGYGATLIDADKVAKCLMEEDSAIKNSLRLQFGDSVIENESISSARLGKLAFASLENLKALNSIVHPPLIKHLYNLVHKDTGDVKVLDAALIPLWNIENWFDLKIWIDTPVDVRLKRVCAAKISKTELLTRMKLQEELFSPPDTNRWMYVSNQSGFEQMKKDIGQILSHSGFKICTESSQE